MFFTSIPVSKKQDCHEAKEDKKKFNQLSEFFLP